MSYIPKQIKPAKERIEAKLEQELIRQLERYCEYLESDRDERHEALESVPSVDGLGGTQPSLKLGTVSR